MRMEADPAAIASRKRPDQPSTPFERRGSFPPTRAHALKAGLQPIAESAVYEPIAS
jgi:hypothetical protein